MMKNWLHSREDINKTEPSLNTPYKSNTIQLSVTLVLTFFAWFFIIPSNICSYAYVLAANFHISESQFLLLSNSAGLLGLLAGGFIALLTRKIEKLLLALVSCLLFFNFLLLLVPTTLELIFLLVQYFLLGSYVSITTYNFLIHTLEKKRYVFSGSILAAIAFSTAFFKSSSDGVTVMSVYTMNIVLSLVAFVLLIVLNFISKKEHSITEVRIERKPVNGTMVLMCLYTLILSISLGYLSNETELSIARLGTLSSLLNTVPYIGAMVLVFSLPMRRKHIGIITYVANAVLIISITFADYYDNSSVFSALVNILLYFSIAINQLFIFDSTFELADLTATPSIYAGIGLFFFVGGSSVGDHIGEAIVVSRIENVDRILITLVAFASLILPLLRIMLSNLSKDSIFRINPVVVDRITPESGSNQHSENEHLSKQGPSHIYQQIVQYDTLTNREKEVLDLLLKGYPSEVICSTLFISANTLKRHVQNIYNKLNVHNRAELFRLINSPRI